MTAEKTVLIVGGPDSGKTNYLGRLWLAIHNQKNKLEVDGTPADLAYLNEIASYYLKGQFAPRTSADFRTKVAISIKTNSGGKSNKIKLTVPDVSGEEWIEIYKKRGWSDQWEKIVSDIIGCLLFVRVDSSQNVPAIDWINWPRIYKNPTPNIQGAPTQVLLVDWLQCLITIFNEIEFRDRPRICIVVSAFDLVASEQKKLGPDEYLKSNFPLFWQYIHTQDYLMNIKVFGTSIAGGDFNTDQNFRKTFIESDPEEAGCVYFHSDTGVKETKDMTLPVAWVMGL